MYGLPDLVALQRAHARWKRVAASLNKLPELLRRLRRRHPVSHFFRGDTPRLRGVVLLCPLRVVPVARG